MDNLKFCYKKSWLILPKLSKSKAILKDIYEKFQNDSQSESLEKSLNIDSPSGIEIILNEILCYKIEKHENLEEEILFFLTAFSNKYFCIKMKTLTNVLEVMVKKENNEKSFTKKNLIKIFLYLAKDFYNMHNTILTQFDHFLNIMDKFFKYFMENEILFSFLVPKLELEELKSANFSCDLEINMIPKIEGLFYPFLSLLFRILETLFMEFNADNQEVIEIRIITLLIFIKKIIFLAKKKESEKNKKTSFIESDDFEKILIVHSKNYKELPDNKMIHLEIGIHFNDEFDNIYDVIFYKIFHILTILPKLTHSVKNLKESKAFNEYLSILSDFNKLFDGYIFKNFEISKNFILTKELFKNEFYKKPKENKKFNALSKDLDKEKICLRINEHMRNLTVVIINCEKAEEYQSKISEIKEFVKKLKENINASQLFDYLIEKQEIITKLIVPFLFSEKICLLKTVFDLFLIYFLYIC